jgi:hypothetical protein
LIHSEDAEDCGNAPTVNPDGSTIGKITTLQEYYGGPNKERIEYMEKYSSLSSKGLRVSVEQVSMFLTEMGRSSASLRTRRMISNHQSSKDSNLETLFSALRAMDQ